MTPYWKSALVLGAKWQWMPRRSPRPCPSPECQQAMELIAAIDAGGIPLHPAKVNHVARQLGLEVSRRAPVEDTIARIRVAVGVEQSYAQRDYGTRAHAAAGFTMAAMKTSYLFIAILASSVLGAFVSGRSAKNALFIVTGLIALYGLFRLLG